MISLIEHEVAKKKQWIGMEELLDVFAIAESTPGPIAINSATYIGYKQAGLSGAAWATLGVVLPSFIIIYVISLFIERFMALTVVAYAFKGIQVAVAFLILRAGFRLICKLAGDRFAAIVCAVAFVLVLAINLFAWNISTIWLILAGAVCGSILLKVKMAGEEMGK